MNFTRFIAAVLGAIAWLATASGASSAVVSGSYYEDSGTCGYSADPKTCILNFPPLSSATLGKYVMLDEISCTGSTSKQLERGYLYVTDNGLNSRRFQGLDVPKSIDAFSFTAHKKLLLGGGVQLLLYFETYEAASFNISCTMVGTIITNP